MRTTVNINSILLNKIKSASSANNISKNELILILLSKLINSNEFNPKPYKAVKYQDSYPGIVWKREHIQLDPVFYEKVLDFRRNFKYSVSWLISYAVMNYLDKLVKELDKSGTHEYFMDNYPRNYIYISKMLGGIHMFITILGVPEEKYLEKLLI